MKIICDKSNPPLGGLMAVEFYKASKNAVEVGWGNESTVTLPNSKKPVPYGTSNDLIRILENAFNKRAEPLQKVTMNHWLSFSLILDDEIPKSLEYLDTTLGPLTYLVGESLSVSDLAVFSVLHVSTKFKTALKTKSPKNIIRWMKLIEAQAPVEKVLTELSPQVLEFLAKCSFRRSPPANTQAVSSRQQEGKFIDLPHAEMGKVVVRFPPEASGYLHIGHAKAALLNQYYQKAFDGKLIMRFDDTNPAKENAEFEKVILEDVEMLDIKPDLFTHTSQYFDLMLLYCEKLIKESKAFVDDTPPEQMKNEREQKVESKNRNNNVAKNLQLWEEMKKGSDIGVTCCVRAKIDMQSANGCLRDPTIYRCKPEVHPRTGTKYKVYPTYDFACPIVDSVEGVTHVLRTMEYHDRDPQFYWFIDAIGLRKPYIWEYSRLSMTNTVLSKRKLTWFVENSHVDGWDDPRMPTVRGVLRRGMTVEGLRQFITAQGSSRSVVFMEWDKIWAINKKVIDPIAPRYTALEGLYTVPVKLKGVTEDTSFDVPLHPKNPAVGTKTIWVSPTLLIDQADGKLLKEGENATFVHYGNVFIDKVYKNPCGSVVSVEATPNLDNKDYKKTVKLTWLADSPRSPFVNMYCVYFEHIINKAVLAKDDDFKKFVSPLTRWDIPMLGEPELCKVKEGDIIQLQRRGFFRVDVPPSSPSQHTFCNTPLILFHVPDGHTKEGKDWKLAAGPQTAPDPTTFGNPGWLHKQIITQFDLVHTYKQKIEPTPNEADFLREAMKGLSFLREKYQEVTGKEWEPNAALADASKPAPAATKPAPSSAADSLDQQITSQGDLVRSLKSAKAEKAKIDEAVKALLDLKAKYKAAVGQEWKPSAAPAAASKPAPAATKPALSSAAGSLDQQITSQGDLVRSLKSAKAEKAKIDEAVKALLDLKAKYKAAVGQEWKPSAAPAAASKPSPAATKPALSSAADSLDQQITSQGDLVRSLKSAKAEKAKVDEAVKALLDLKAKYKAAVGQEWKPSAAPAAASKPAPAATKPALSSAADSLDQQITSQGDLVRSLKSAKAEKAKIDEAVKALLDLKAKYKAAVGQDWKPGAAPATTPAVPSATAVPLCASSEAVLNEVVAKQAYFVHSLKSNKADKGTIDEAVKGLQHLQYKYKISTGQDWVPRATPTMASAASISVASTNPATFAAILALDEVIAKQGDQVRSLKSSKADKAAVDAAVKTLLDLKANYKLSTGHDWKPSPAPAPAPATPQQSANSQAQQQSGNNQVVQLLTQIVAQGEKVRRLKEEKVDKSVLNVEIKNLLNLKAQYKSFTGEDWTPNAVLLTCEVTPAKTSGGDAAAVAAMGAAVAKQGDLVRELKTKKADKAAIDEAVKNLLILKAKYQSETGTPYAPPAPPRDTKPKEKKEKPKEVKKEAKVKEQSPKPAKEDSTTGVKKVTRLGLEASKETDLPEWYSQVITKSEMIDYYDISGCYILRPWSYSIWDTIRTFLSKEFRKLGVKEGYFPMFVSKAALEREQSHIADFSPEVAWVTHSGSSELAEHIAIRPTSETGMYPAYARWIQSHRDLPFKLNQWNNVVRWEFKQPQPFLRTREFLWQEGHTAYRFQEEAEEEVLVILDLYARVYEELLAVPVIKGRKTEKEKFAGGYYTTTVEAYIPASGRAIQGATSHHLGQNFSKMFEVVYDDPDTHEKAYVYQNSWGLTTRTIGVMILVHGDDRGLVLPPRVADVQVVVVPCGVTASSTAEERKLLMDSCKELVGNFIDAGIRAEGDYRDNYSPGWKFNHWELKGVPIRVELGPKDMAKGEVVAVRRLTGDKRTLKRGEAGAALAALLEATHHEMFERATKERDARLTLVTKWDDFTEALERKHILLAPFCGEIPCEDNIKKDSARTDDDPTIDVKAPAMGAKSLCIPFKQARELTASDRCIHPACNNKPTKITMFGRSY